MADLDYEFKAEIWLYSGKASWHFVTVPEDISQHIKSFSGEKKSGFGSVRIAANIGATRWLTSIFPDKRSGCYFLPIKADIRKKENLKQSSKVLVRLELDIA